MSVTEEKSVGLVETRRIRVVEEKSPLRLKSGKSLGPIDVAYETYGSLNENGDNAILICHALSGDAHVAGFNSNEDKKAGWWDNMVGPGKGIDTDKYFVICSNCLGGCSGTTGPGDINPATGKPYGLDFPIITMEDMVEVQRLLVEKLGIKSLLCVVGGSMGGMQVMQWSVSYPDLVKSAIVVASSTRLNPQAIAFDAVGRHCILADSEFHDGQYHDSEGPGRGLAIARMIGHITYLSEKGMRAKFGRSLRNSKDYKYDLDSEFSVETYLDYQGQTFVERFDANSYLYITKAMDYFDLSRDAGSLVNAMKPANSRFLVVSFTSDWLFPPEQSEEFVYALSATEKDVSYCNIESPYGHDAFLLEPDKLGKLISGFVDSVYMESGDGGNCTSLKKSYVKPFDRSKRLRVDYEIIESLIGPHSKVLDIGSGDGELLARLTEDKKISGEGIELDEDLVIHSIERGLSIVHRDIERGLKQYGDNSFDYVILSQTLQTIMYTDKVFEELLRVGRKVIISFPNFAYWKCRLQLAFMGIAPKTKQLPWQWYNSPNIHFLSLKDFDQFCAVKSVCIEKKIPMKKTSRSPIRFCSNFFAEQAVYLTSKSEGVSQ